MPRIKLWIISKIALDTGVWFSATFLAYVLRFESAVTSHLHEMIGLAIWLLPIKFLLVVLFGLHKFSWRFATLSDYKAPVYAVGAFSVMYQLFALLNPASVMIPRSIPFLEACLTVLGFVSIRIASRIALRPRKHIPHLLGKAARRILVIGAGESGTVMVKEMHRHIEMGMVPVGFLDDKPSKQGQRIQQIPVLGKLDDLPRVAREHEVDELVICMPSESGEALRRVVAMAQKAKLPYKTIPGLYDLINGSVTISQLREVQVEDLLRRSPIQLDSERISAYLRGRCVMVTGAGGSIGSEVVRQVCRFRPSKVVLVGRGENSIHEAVREFQARYPQIPFVIKIADVRDIDTLDQIFAETQPEVIFHAAAHKHVPLMEANPAQAVYNNVGGTRNLATLALEYGVQYFVNISTDKAVNPTSVMGASKRVAEYTVQRAAAQAREGQVFVSVRFGNVLGSRGSVVPIFKDQIRKGGPITITDPEMIRYFMTIPEASQLVLQAGALNRNGAVYVLDMGEPVKIVDMARDLIRLSGLEPDVDIKISFTGVREGEKLYEELLTAEEGTEMTQYDKIMFARKRDMPPTFDAQLDALFEAARTGEKPLIQARIKDLVPSYKPTAGTEKARA